MKKRKILIFSSPVNSVPCFTAFAATCGGHASKKDRLQKYISDESAEVDLLQVGRNKFFYRALRQLGADCQKLLQLFFQKQNMEAIAQAMNFASEGYARVRKSQWKERLVVLIKNDPEFGELQNA
jgi:hypothetical protein